MGRDTSTSSDDGQAWRWNPTPLLSYLWETITEYHTLTPPGTVQHKPRDEKEKTLFSWYRAAQTQRYCSPALIAGGSLCRPDSVMARKGKGLPAVKAVCRCARWNWGALPCVNRRRCGSLRCCWLAWWWTEGGKQLPVKGSPADAPSKGRLPAAAVVTGRGRIPLSSGRLQCSVDTVWRWDWRCEMGAAVGSRGGGRKGEITPPVGCWADWGFGKRRGRLVRVLRVQIKGGLQRGLWPHTTYVGFLWLASPGGRCSLRERRTRPHR